MSEQKKDSVDLKKNTTKIITSVIVVIIVFLLGMVIGKNRTNDVEENSGLIEETILGESENKEDPLVASDGLIHPKAPGPWATGAVKNLNPETFVVGQNTLSADIKGLFIEGVGMLKIYDNLTEVFSTEIKAVDGSDFENVFTSIDPVLVTIPEALRGKTLIVRFMQPSLDGKGEMQYFGQTVTVK